MKAKRFISWLLPVAMMITMIPSYGITIADDGSGLSPLATTPEVLQSDTKENTNQAGGIIYTKTSTAKSDGTIDITLTAHTTGVVKQMNSVSPTDIVLVLDVSGSMDQWNKLPLVKQAFLLLTEHLRPGDTISIVTYAS